MADSEENVELDLVWRLTRETPFLNESVKETSWKIQSQAPIYHAVLLKTSKDPMEK